MLKPNDGLVAEKTPDQLERERLAEAIKSSMTPMAPPTNTLDKFPIGGFRDLIAKQNNLINTAAKQKAQVTAQATPNQLNSQVARGINQTSLGAQSVATPGLMYAPATETGGQLNAQLQKQLEDRMRAMQGQAQGQPQMQVAQPLVSRTISAEEQMQRIPEGLPQAQKDMMRAQIAFKEQNADEIKALEDLATTVGVKSQEIIRKYGYDPEQITQDDAANFSPEMQAELNAASAEFESANISLKQKFNDFSRQYAQQQPPQAGLMAQQFSSSSSVADEWRDYPQFGGPDFPDVDINPPPPPQGPQETQGPQGPTDFTDQVSGLPAYGERPQDTPAVYAPEFEHLSQLNPMGDPNFNWESAAQEIQNIIVGKKEPNMAYDLNQDGLVNVSDTRVALDYSVGNLPNPFTEPGIIMEPAQYNQQQIIAGQPQGPGEVNIMDYFGAQASAPVLQPELQLATQLQRQQVQEGELQTVPSLGADPTVTAPDVSVAQVNRPTESDAALATASLAQTADKAGVTLTEAERVAGTLPTTEFAQGQVSQDAQVGAEQGEISEGGIAKELEFDKSYTERVDPSERIVTNQELATAAGKNVDAIESNIAQSDALKQAVAQKGVVRPEELPKPAQIAEDNIVQAEAIVADGLADDAIAVAERMEKFSVDEGTLAKFEQGEVDAKATVQGQLADLMKSFDDGTPAWAAGAIRAANQAMAARGMGASSMAGAAILQAAMESAIPIAQQDAQTFAQMGITNLNNKTQVALQNAAAQQGVELKNFDARQQAALQNSANSFALQAQNLSNMQQVVIANAQIKSAMQGQNLSNEQQSNLSVAARFAELANLNLSNAQQTELQNNVNGLQTNLANLSSKQQAYITNANLAASLQGQVISNEQQVSIANAAKFADANNLTFSAEQQAQLHNSSLMQTIGLANLNSKQASVLQNAATLAGMDMANLDNRQQAAVLNAQAFLQMDMANLSNEQQALMFDSQSRIQAIFNDQSAQNVANNINAASQNDVDNMFMQLETSVNQTNAAQENVVSQFNATAENQNTQFFEELGLQADKINVDAINDMTEFSADQILSASQFSASMKNNREQFQINNQVAIDANNIQWLRDVNTANTATVNAAVTQDVQNLFGIQQSSLNNIRDHYDTVLNFAFKAEESAMDRTVNMAMASLDADTRKAIQSAAEDSDLFAAIFNAGARILASESGWETVSGWFE